MNNIKGFQKGDIVIHRARPEWGQGTVDAVMPILHAGKPAQRIVVQFAHHGRVTLNTAVAAIAIEGTNSVSSVEDGPSLLRGDTDEDDRRRREQQLRTLPTDMTDPFSSFSVQLRATLNSYRYAAAPWHSCMPRDARRLIDWAIVQTGLTDPQSQFPRHELEAVYPRFARDRDAHWLKLVQQTKKQGRQDLLRQCLDQMTDPVVRSVLQDALR